MLYNYAGNDLVSELLDSENKDNPKKFNTLQSSPKRKRQIRR